MNSDAKTLNLYPIDYPFETLLSRIIADKPKLILDPDFQRKYKWDKEGWARASKFIESCLMRIPLPSCYFAEEKDGRHIVIDGVQRLTTIVKFMNDGFALEGLTAFKDLEGKKFSEIGDLKEEFEATTIRCIVLRKENPQHLVREIFSRLNQGAVSLSDQEIRHALYPGPFDELLRRLSDIPTVKNFGKGKKSEVARGDRDSEEQVLRYFALRGELVLYSDRLAKYLDDFMQTNANLPESEIQSMEHSFIESLNRCVEIFGDDVFRDTTRAGTRQSMIYYDLLMPSLGVLPKVTAGEKSSAIRAAFAELCRSKDFQKTTSSGLQNKVSIVRRRDIWKQILEKHLQP